MKGNFSSSFVPMAVSIFSLSTWFIVLNLFHPSPIVDEYTHVRVVEALVNGRWEAIREVPMIPGYHVLVAGLGLLKVPALIAGRFLSYLSGLITVIFASLIIQSQADSKPRLNSALIPIIPFLFPFSALAYTDMLSVLFIVAALWARSAKKHYLPIVSLVMACLVRQTNIVWLVFFAVWTLADEFDFEGFRFMFWLRRTSMYWLALFFLSLFYEFGNFTTPNLENNQLKVNFGNIILFSLGLFICLFPLWLGDFRRFIAEFARIYQKNKRLAVLFSVIFLGLWILLISSYSNWHPWNYDGWFIHNLPLIWMDESQFIRKIIGLLVYLILGISTFLWITQPQKRLLVVVSLVSTISLIPLGLAEIRYSIIPILLIIYFVPLSRKQVFGLGIWFTTLNVGLCSLIVSGSGML
jgi:alpha-1,2-glucosyltransferase